MAIYNPSTDELPWSARGTRTHPQRSCTPSGAPRVTTLPSLGENVHVAQLRYAYSQSSLDDLQRQMPLPERLQRAVLLRRLDFLAGRWCARESLRLAGFDEALPLPLGNHGSPVWPSGWIGSISHDDGWAIAAAAPLDRVHALGLDIETKLLPDVADTIHPQIAHHHELALLDERCIDRVTGLTVLFSAKESLFKALYPQVGCYFDFLDAALVDINADTGTLSLRLLKTLSDTHREHGAYPLRFDWCEGRVLTRCVLPAPR